MHGILEELLRLERAKQQALIEGNAPVYDESVRAQLHVLESNLDLETDARLFPDKLATLGRIIRLNAALFWNRMAVSPVFERSRVRYTAQGTIETRTGCSIEVEA